MSEASLNLLDEATRLHAAGLCVLPAFAKTKVPAVESWKRYQRVRPAESELVMLMRRASALCVICGEVSGHVELLDFDVESEQFEAWANLIRDRSPGLLERLYLERSQSGGMHAVYRCGEPVEGAMKLSGRIVACESNAEVVIAGKRYKPRKSKGGGFEVQLTLIETKGESGLFLCAPSPGYERVQGDLANLPVLTSEEHAVLIDAAIELDLRPRLANEPSNLQTASRSSVLVNRSTSSNRTGTRPGDIYNAEGDIRPLLMKHGWTLSRTGDNEYWIRPGKTAGTSATFNGHVFYVFSSNAAPFEPDRGFSKFAVLALLEHEGNFGRAASALRQMGFGSPASNPQPTSTDQFVEDQTVTTIEVNDGASEPVGAAPVVDPGPIPGELLRVPGFIGEVMDYTLGCAPYPEPVLAFSGALALQAVLAGRAVRDAQDNRPALYIVSLANSGTGKDFPRKVNQRVLIEAGMAAAIGDGFASGEGIEDRMEAQPSVLFQTDEIDALLQAITASGRQRDPRFEGIMQVLLKMYTSCSSAYTMRVKAKQTKPRIIDQPCLCLLGTAIPATFYKALSPKMLSNGFFSRMQIFEAGSRGRGQDAEIVPVPDRLIRIARRWAKRQGAAVFSGTRHEATIVALDAGASNALSEVRELADDAYQRSESLQDQVGMALWARAVEKTRRLALNYACSENFKNPKVSTSAVRWAWRLTEHQTRSMLFRAAQHVSADDFEGRCKAVLQVLAEWASAHDRAWMPYWRISRKLPWDTRDHDAVRQSLLDQLRIEYQEQNTGGPKSRSYRLRGTAQ